MKLYTDAGLVNHEVKVFTALTKLNDKGEFNIDYSHVGFNHVYTVQATPHFDYDSFSETPLGASVTFFDINGARGLSARGTVLGLLVGMANIKAHETTEIAITVIGE